MTELRIHLDPSLFNDDERVEVFDAIAVDAGTEGDLADRLDLHAGELQNHLIRLMEGGVVTLDETGLYQLTPGVAPIRDVKGSRGVRWHHPTIGPVDIIYRKRPSGPRSD